MTAIKLQPNIAVAFDNSELESAKLKKADAISFAENASAISPTRHAFLNRLAVLRSDKGDYARAVDLRTKAATTQPQNALFKPNLAKIHMRGGKTDLVKAHLQGRRKWRSC